MPAQSCWHTCCRAWWMEPGLRRRRQPPEPPCDLATLCWQLGLLLRWRILCWWRLMATDMPIVEESKIARSGNSLESQYFNITTGMTDLLQKPKVKPPGRFSRHRVRTALPNQNSRTFQGPWKIKNCALSSSFRALTLWFIYLTVSRYLPYSIHFSEFMPICFMRKCTKHKISWSLPFSYMICIQDL